MENFNLEKIDRALRRERRIKGKKRPSYNNGWESLLKPHTVDSIGLFEDKSSRDDYKKPEFIRKKHYD